MVIIDSGKIKYTFLPSDNSQTSLKGVLDNELYFYKFFNRT